MKKQKSLDTFVRILSILIPLILGLLLIFFSFLLVLLRIADVKTMGNEGYHSSTGLMLFTSSRFLFFVNIVTALIIFFIFTFNTHLRYNPKHRKHFKWLMLAPVINQILYAIVWFIASNYIK